MASDAYLKIKDVPGSSSDKDHKDWVEVLSHSFSMHMPIGAGPGGVRNAGRVNIEDFVITKAVDKASPSMMQHCCKGTYFPSMEVEVMNANGDRNKLIKYTLENVYISSFRSVQLRQDQDGVHSGGRWQARLAAARWLGPRQEHCGGVTQTSPLGGRRACLFSECDHERGVYLSAARECPAPTAR